MDQIPGNINGANAEEFQMPGGQANNQFGAVRDRLFHAILVKIALGYNKAVPHIWRQIVEFCSLFFALCMLCLLLFVHLMSSRTDATCLDHLAKEWPRDGVLRLEVVENLDVLEYKEQWIAWYKSDRSQLACHFNIRDVLLLGPKAMPAEVRQRRFPPKIQEQRVSKHSHFEPSEGIFSYIMKLPRISFGDGPTDFIGDIGDTEEMDDVYPFWLPSDQSDPFDEDAQAAFADMFKKRFDKTRVPQTQIRTEYALHYGLLRLPMSYRERKNIKTLSVRLDADSTCFGDSLMRLTMKALMGYEDALMTSLRRLAQNETMDDGLGYLHNLDTNEYYHFVRNGMSKMSYITAAFVMVFFTFAISLLLHFSHHQIFVFILNLLHMFELNQPLQFPAAPLLTVILALVGMEAIMSEVFADTSTAFYVILLVWIADQFDAICCHSPTSKRYWIRFFYLYQFFFYAYQYRFGGQYGGLALVTSISFIAHSMIFFFHHYEIPLILYREEMQRIFSQVQAVRQVIPEAPPNQMPIATMQNPDVNDHIQPDSGIQDNQFPTFSDDSHNADEQLGPLNPDVLDSVAIENESELRNAIAEESHSEFTVTVGSTDASEDITDETEEL